MGIDRDLNGALTKAIIAAGTALPEVGSALLSIADQDKPDAIEMVRQLHQAGYTLYATEGTAALVRGLGLEATGVPKRLSEEHPNVGDIIRDQTGQLVVNTPEGRRGALRDGFHIRRAAVETRIPLFSSIDTAVHAVRSLISRRLDYNVLTMQEYTADNPRSEKRQATSLAPEGS